MISRNFIDENDNSIENKFGYFKSAILNNIDKLVIQSNSNPEIVRKFILKNGFYIEKIS